MKSMKIKQQTRSTCNILVLRISHPMYFKQCSGRPLKMDFGDHRKYRTAFSRLFNCSDKCVTITIEDCGKENSLFVCALDRCDFEENYIST